MLVFIIPLISLFVFRHIQNDFNDKYRQNAIQTIQESNELSLEEKDDATAFFTQMPLSELILDAEFVAAVQVIVYAGAILVLFLFTVLLLDLKEEVGGERFVRPKGWDLTVFFGGKTLFFSLALVVPLLMHPTWVVLLLYMAVSLVQGVVLSVVFQLAHCVEEAAFPLPRQDTGRMQTAWELT